MKPRGPSPGDGDKLTGFQRAIRSADRFGVFDEFRKLYRKARRQGLDEQAAADQALRQAVGEKYPEAVRDSMVVFREGKA